jgi:hypothetical protein
MRFYIFLLLTLFVVPAFGQHRKQRKTPPPPPFFVQKINTTKYLLKERQALYPFNLATQIKLISFDKRVVAPIKPITDSTIENNSMLVFDEPDEVYGIPVNFDTIDLSKTCQTISLTRKGIDSLTDILYNTCSRWTITQKSKGGCYYPHNAIVFFNSDDQPFEYIELCFDCNQLKYSSNNVVEFEDCDIAFNEVETYFKSFGLKTSSKEFESK